MKLQHIIQWSIIGLFFVLVLVQSQKKFVLDEIDFPIVSFAASETGLPIYYRGEDTPHHIGIYHPTLYIHSLALFIKLFGFNEGVVRLFGAISVFLSALIMLQIYRLLFLQKEELEKDFFSIIFLSLYLLNPYTIANATLPDIDSTILPALLLAFIYLALHFFKDVSNINVKTHYKAIFYLGLLFAVNLWAKLTTPLILPVFLFGLLLLKNRLKRSLLVTALTALVGLAIFLVTYLTYCFMLHLPAVYTFSFLLQSFTKGTSGGISLFDKILFNITFLNDFIYWVTLPLTTLIVAGFYNALSKIKNRGYDISLLLGILALLTTIFYICLISPFGGFFKYPFAVFSLLLLLPSVFLAEYIYQSRKNNLILTAFAFFIFIGYIETKYFSDTVFKTHIMPNHYLELLIASVFFWYAVCKMQLKSIALFLFAFTLGWSVGLSRVQAIATYPTKYDYGQIGLDESVSYLKTRLSPDDIIWSMKDIGYYSNNHYIESYGYYFDKKLENNLVDLLHEKKVKYFVGTVNIGEDRLDAYPSIKKILDENALFETQIGNYMIYKNKFYE